MCDGLREACEGFPRATLFGQQSFRGSGLGAQGEATGVTQKEHKAKPEPSPKENNTKQTGNQGKQIDDYFFFWNDYCRQCEA